MKIFTFRFQCFFGLVFIIENSFQNKIEMCTSFFLWCTIRIGFNITVIIVITIIIIIIGSLCFECFVESMCTSSIRIFIFCAIYSKEKIESKHAIQLMQYNTGILNHLCVCVWMITIVDYKIHDNIHLHMIT